MVSIRQTGPVVTSGFSNLTNAGSSSLMIQEVARRKESAVNIAKHKETVGDALDKAHRDRGRRGLP